MQAREAKEFASGRTAKRLISVSPETSVKQALQLMKESKIHHLVVLKDGRCRGIVSARDLFGEVHAADLIGKFLHPDVPLLDEQTDIKTALDLPLEKRTVS